MRIYVGGLTYATTSDELRNLFATAGNVADANVVEDKYSGQSRGFGFVDMPDAAEAKAAIAKFNGYSHDGRSLTVNEAKPREDNGGGRSGGGRGGYGGGGGSRW
jgi:RNA recognition motif-containing protein